MIKATAKMSDITSLISDVISFIFAVIFIKAETRKITQELSINIKEKAS